MSRAFKPYKARLEGTTAALVSRMAEEAGGVERAGFLLGLSRTQMYGFTDGDGDRSMSLDQARRLALATGSASFAHDAASLAGGVFCPAPTGNASVAHLTGAGNLGFAAFMQKVLAALGDGNIDSHERPALLAQLNDVIHTLAQCRARLMADGLPEQAGGAK